MKVCEYENLLEERRRLTVEFEGVRAFLEDTAAIGAVIHSLPRGRTQNNFYKYIQDIIDKLSTEIDEIENTELQK